MNESCYIIGMEIITALGIGIDETWSRILKKESGILPFSRFDSNLYTTNLGAEIPHHFTEHFFSLDHTSSKGRAYQLAFKVAQNVIKEASSKIPFFSKGTTGLILSTTKAEIEEMEDLYDGKNTVNGYFNPFEMTKGLAFNLGLEGPVLAVSGACASGLLAIFQGKMFLEQKMAKSILIVGVDVLSHFLLSGFSSLSALSKNPCKPYDELRDGLSLGEGAGAILLTNQEVPSSLKLARINGVTITNDGHRITSPSPTGRGLQKALTQLFKESHFQKDEISYINGNGTGTIVNDEMEGKALGEIFSNKAPLVSSFKGALGHTLGGAGVIELALCVKSLLKNTIPPCVGFENSSLEKWISLASQKSAFPKANKILSLKSGFGGINGALALSGVLES